MFELFKLSEAITKTIARATLKSEKKISFSEAIINLESFKISFSSLELKIVVSCSIHPLDMPWQLRTEIIRNSKSTISLENWKSKKYNIPLENIHLVTPNLLKTENLLNSFTVEFGNDIQLALADI